MDVGGLIGNTPIIKINYDYLGNKGSIYAKLEYYNLSGSIKDRMAYYMIKDAKEKGILSQGMPIVEATSGNTGISMAALGAYYKHPVHIFMPDWVSEERRKIITLYGAQVHLYSKEEGGFQRCIKEADLLAEKLNGFRPHQFSNIGNVVAHYDSTAVELKQKLKVIDAFVSGIGTGGTLIGVGKRLKEDGTKIYALEPKGLPLLSMGVTEGMHRIEGIGDDFIPELVDRSIIDDIFLIDDEDAILMAQKLAKELGLGVGISSGANLLAAIYCQQQYHYDVVATVFVDDNKKYISTDLSRCEMKDGQDVSKISLLNFDVL